MKKLINVSFIYAIAALAAGVFYREYTKFNGFTGRTALGFMHVHLFALGMLLFLLLALFAKSTDLLTRKQFRTFFITYNIGLPLTVIMMLVRGVIEVSAPGISAGASAMISGIAGIGHIFAGVGIIFLFLALKQCAEEKN